MHLQGFLATLLALVKRWDWPSHDVNYRSYTTKDPRAISRCYYDAVPLLTSQTGATQKKKGN